MYKMNFTRFSIILAGILLFMGCAGQEEEKVPNIVLEGTATYYASFFHGRMMANGEIYHRDSMHAAHDTLPFGTRVKVTNLNNDSSVVVHIADRLNKRIPSGYIDLSRAASRQLNMREEGRVPVTMELLDWPDTSQVKASAPEETR
ncbi:MAG: septal ring lytic transglycosylase RlpA family protein [Bacteroidia bacterium]